MLNNGPSGLAMVPGRSVVGWFALCGQKALVPELVDRIEAAVQRAMADPTLIRRMVQSGLMPRFEKLAAIAQRRAKKIVHSG